MFLWLERAPVRPSLDEAPSDDPILPFEISTPSSLPTSLGRFEPLIVSLHHSELVRISHYATSISPSRPLTRALQEFDEWQHETKPATERGLLSDAYEHEDFLNGGIESESGFPSNPVASIKSKQSTTD